MWLANSQSELYERSKEANVSPLESVIEGEKNRDRAEMLGAVKVLRRMFPDGVSLLELAQAAVDRITELEKFLKQAHEDHCETDEACRKIAEKFLSHSEVYGEGYQVPLEDVFRMVVERLTTKE